MRRSLVEAADTIRNAPALVPDGTLWVDPRSDSLNVVAAGRNIRLVAADPEQQTHIDALVVRHKVKDWELTQQEPKP